MGNNGISVVAKSRLGGLEDESVGQSKEIDVEHVGNDFLPKMLKIVMRMNQF